MTDELHPLIEQLLEDMAKNSRDECYEGGWINWSNPAWKEIDRRLKAFDKLHPEIKERL